MIVAITGPGGSGKSTISHELVKHIGNCVNIKVDHVKHVISHRDFDYKDTAEGIEQWRMLGENLGLVARNCHKHGYDIIIDGYLNESAWVELEKYVVFTHKVLILPEADVVVERDSKREKDRLDEEMVRTHHKYFSNDKRYSDFTEIDSSNMTVEETTKAVLKILGKNWGEL